MTGNKWTAFKSISILNLKPSVILITGNKRTHRLKTAILYEGTGPKFVSTNSIDYALTSVYMYSVYKYLEWRLARGVQFSHDPGT